MEQLMFEVGVYYRTKNGDRAVVLSIDKSKMKMLVLYFTPTPIIDWVDINKHKQGGFALIGRWQYGVFNFKDYLCALGGKEFEPMSKTLLDAESVVVGDKEKLIKSEIERRKNMVSPPKVDSFIRGMGDKEISELYKTIKKLLTNAINEAEADLFESFLDEIDDICSEGLTYELKATNIDKTDSTHIRPDYYRAYDVEVRDMMIRIWGRQAYISFCQLNAFKYRMRAGQKDNNSVEQDLKKEAFYLNEAKLNIKFL